MQFWELTAHTDHCRQWESRGLDADGGHESTMIFKSEFFVFFFFPLYFIIGNAEQILFCFTKTL